MAETTHAPRRATIRAVNIGDTLGPYELVDELGAGGMATVFRATDRRLRRDVAIKVLHPHLAKRRELAARFHREARAVATLDHPNVLRIHDVGGHGEDDDAGPPGSPAYIVLELIDGSDLETWSNTNPDLEPLPTEIVIATAIVISRALAHAHAHGVIHRDIKPANIIMSTSGRVVLSDFGVARLADDDGLTQTGALVGTPAFMSPEQTRGDTLSPQSDLYSLGATLYRLAAGVPPYRGSTSQVIASINAGRRYDIRQHNPRCTPQLAAIIDRAMATAPQDRFASAQNMADTLEASYRSLDLPAPETLLQGFLRAPHDYHDGDGADARGALRDQALALAGAGSRAHALLQLDYVLSLNPNDPDAVKRLHALRHRSRARWLGLGLGLAIIVCALLYLGVFHANATRPVRATAVPDAPPRQELDHPPRPSVSTEHPQRTPTPQKPHERRADKAPARVAKTRPRLLERPKARANKTKHALPRAKPTQVDTAPTTAPHTAPSTQSDVSTAPAAAPQEVHVEIIADTWCEIFVDDVAYGPWRRGKRVPLEAGTHRFACVQEQTGLAWRATRTIEPQAQPLRLTAQLLPGVEVKIALTTATSVEIADKTYKNGARLRAKQGRTRVRFFKDDRLVWGPGWLTLAGPSCQLVDGDRPSCRTQTKP